LHLPSWQNHQFVLPNTEVTLTNMKFDGKRPNLHLFFVVGVTPWKGTLSEIHTLFMLHLIRLGPGKHHLKFDTPGTFEASYEPMSTNRSK